MGGVLVDDNTLPPDVPVDPPVPPVMLACPAVSEPPVIPQVEPAVPPSLSVAEQLSLSRAAHVRYRELHDRTENSDEAAMTAAIQAARDARAAALALDPQQHDPAWRIDVFEGKPVSHADLMLFYEAYLATD